MTDPMERTTEDEPGVRARYDAVAAQQRWQAYWAEHDTFAAKDDGTAERRYMLDMFPYPSGDLHMGHAEAFVMGDVVARYWRLKGYDVLHPIGWDSFGLPAENAAIQRNAHPAEWTYANIETQATSFRRYGLSFDWSRRLHTSDPEYYRWTQWLFLRFRERGLAYRKASYVNWCPKDQTVLANEQVVAGLCERCGSQVTKRQLTQWYFKITEYAQRLLDDMDGLTGAWPDRVLTMQRNWIGQSEGAYVDFRIEGRDEPVTVFTTRPDTLCGATFFVIAPEVPLAAEVVTEEHRAAFEAYLEQTKRATEIERQSTDRPKTGVFLGVHAINPVNGERIPVYAADYVLAEYGTGAIMAVPAHDQRDLDFARAYELPVRMVVDTGDPDPAETGIATPGDGTYVNSGPLNGLTDKVAGVAAIIARLEAEGVGKGAITFRLRDWLLSRQRYWGCPIPIIHCERCGEVPVPDDQLPVELPYMKGTDLAPKGTSPLAAATDWVNVDCPSCGGPATRDTDTMDTFVDSSWYFFRYCSPGLESGPFDPEDVRRWMPVDQYVGRRRARDPAPAVHAVLHQGAARHGAGRLRRADAAAAEPGPGDQPGQGDEQVAGQRGRPGRADRRVRGGRDPADRGVRGPAGGGHRLGRRLARRFAAVPAAGVPAGGRRDQRARASTPRPANVELRRQTHRLLAEIEQTIESQRFNVAVARIMELVNAARKAMDGAAGPADPAVREAAEVITVALSLVAPYVAEEMWERLGQPALGGQGELAGRRPAACW